MTARRLEHIAADDCGNLHVAFNQELVEASVAVSNFVEARVIDLRDDALFTSLTSDVA